ncbi:hypothetical protein LSCM1_05593 [Leishmania martiniquensis]|uniref:Uncharacterized protein n=1 Tax=Leishmania martiniquensis TaxID=1580590 RepID=A0A836GYP4_9TRYP|nr:hypothetical protein LSCM1_05593 [Leishmania martiniquensis]
MLRSVYRSAPLAGTAAMTAFSTPAVLVALQMAQRTKYVRQPSAQWDPVHEDINAHVKRRIPGETRVDRVKRFAREWRNVELELGVYKDSRGREVKYRKTFVYRYTYPNAFDEFWWPCK